MKKLFTCLILTIGLFALSWTTPPDREQRTDQPTEYAQVISVDQVMQADFTFVNHVVLLSPDTPAPAKMADMNILMAKADVILGKFQVLSFKIYPKESRSIRESENQLLTFYVPDKSNKDGNFSNRDKLTQMGFTPYTI